MADWGNMRAYIVYDIDFEKNPVSYSFTYNGQEKNMAEYFAETYGKEVRDCD